MNAPLFDGLALPPSLQGDICAKVASHVADGESVETWARFDDGPLCRTVPTATWIGA
jgi:hypothetical protein